MNNLIGFNLIMVVVWFVGIMYSCRKIDDYSHFVHCWILLISLTAIVSGGVYMIWK